MTDIEIAHAKKMMEIKEVAKKIGFTENQLEYYGKYKAKITSSLLSSKKGKLILVTSINPTPYGEGKTTVAIGIHDSLCFLGKKSLAVLREPSLGPVFGTKGGATGGGYSQVVPMEDINLHFTGDIHAVTAANNLLCAIIDNHIFQGNEQGILKDTICLKRVLDINDRALRQVRVGISSSMEREESFAITTSCELMAILCLSKDLEDLKERIGKMVIGYRQDETPVFVQDLHCVGAILTLLKEAIHPNLVQTLYNNPVLIHGGPFANIAHGCNSLIATKLALENADYVVTEAGFGSDLGAFKFLDIKCRMGKLVPNVIVINVTIRALKYHGGCLEALEVPDLSSLEKGFANLQAHILNMQKMGPNIIVCCNRFKTDSSKEVERLEALVSSMGISFALCEGHEKGEEGSLALAQKIISLCGEDTHLNYLYAKEDSIEKKIEIVSREIFYAKEVQYTELAKEKIRLFEKNHLDLLPICVAKTPYSISDDPKKLGFPKDSIVTITDISLSNGAGFLVVYMGGVLTMPGLSKNPAAYTIDMNSEGKITGLF